MIHAMVIASHITGSIPLAIGVFISVSAIVALCAKHARSKVARNYATDDHRSTTSSEKNDDRHYNYMPPKSPLRPPKKLIATISNKAIPFLYQKKEGGEIEELKDEEIEQGFGEGGLWQKDILMGEKCQPLEFSGVIYYDCYGTQVSEMPRSPKPMITPNFTPFSFPVLAKDDQ